MQRRSILHAAAALLGTASLVSPQIGLTQTNPLGLAVPGMPIGSPGMDGPAYGGRKDPYAVLLVQRDGGSSVYQSY